jgi:hypothetical protein
MTARTRIRRMRSLSAAPPSSVMNARRLMGRPLLKANGAEQCPLSGGKDGVIGLPACG